MKAFSEQVSKLYWHTHSQKNNIGFAGKSIGGAHSGDFPGPSTGKDSKGKGVGKGKPAKLPAESKQKPRKQASKPVSEEEEEEVMSDADESGSGNGEGSSEVVGESDGPDEDAEFDAGGSDPDSDSVSEDEDEEDADDAVLGHMTLGSDGGLGEDGDRSGSDEELVEEDEPVPAKKASGKPEKGRGGSTSAKGEGLTGFDQQKDTSVCFNTTLGLGLESRNEFEVR